MKTGLFNAPFLYEQSVDSTNTLLMQKAEHLTHGTTLLADCQTAGKGRLGRQWASDGQGMYLSVLLKDMPLFSLQSLPCACALALCRALQLLGVENCRIKWPNDVVLNGKKIAGILCESRIFSEGCYAVCGVGVNLLQPQIYFENCSLPYGSSIMEILGKQILPYPLAEAFLKQLQPLVVQCQQQPAPFKEEYKQLCLNIGKQVKIEQNNQQKTLQAVDISDDFALVVSENGKKTALHAGEVSVRGLYGYV